jgi:hypothetical protein
MTPIDLHFLDLDFEQKIEIVRPFLLNWYQIVKIRQK